MSLLFLLVQGRAASRELQPAARCVLHDTVAAVRHHQGICTTHHRGPLCIPTRAATPSSLPPKNTTVICTEFNIRILSEGVKDVFVFEIGICKLYLYQISFFIFKTNSTDTIQKQFLIFATAVTARGVFSSRGRAGDIGIAARPG